MFVKNQERIFVFEMLNILIALRILGHQWSNKRLLVWCDDRAVVDVIGGEQN